MREMQENWNEFILGMVGEKPIPKEMYKLMRRSFFCGFVCTMTVITKDIQNISGMDFDKRLRELIKECHEFMREINLERDKEKKSDNV